MKAAFVAAALLMAAPANAEGQGPILSDFVYANALHTLLHELGHAVVSEFNLPILGEEEDAVDNFATLIILDTLPDDAEWILSDVALQWMISHGTVAPNELEFWGEHSLDAQRAYRTLCYLYGTGPDAFDDAVTWIEMPEDYAEFCVDETPLRMDAWFSYLDNIAPDDSAPKQELIVTLEEHPLKKSLETLNLMEEMANFAASDFDWPEPIVFKAESCDEANAYWDLETREVILCYQLLEEWMKLEQDL